MYHFPVSECWCGSLMCFTDVLLCSVLPSPINVFELLSDGEHGFRYFQMASCGQDNQIKLWLLLVADFSGVYSDVSFMFLCLKSLSDRLDLRSHLYCCHGFTAKLSTSGKFSCNCWQESSKGMRHFVTLGPVGFIQWSIYQRLEKIF